MKKYGDLNELKHHIGTIVGYYWNDNFLLDYKAVEQAIEAVPEEDLVPRAIIEEIFDALENILNSNYRETDALDCEVTEYYDADLYDEFYALRKKYVKTKNLYPNQECGECPVWLNIDEPEGIPKEEAVNKFCSKCKLYKEAEEYCKNSGYKGE